MNLSWSLIVGGIKPNAVSSRMKKDFLNHRNVLSKLSRRTVEPGAEADKEARNKSSQNQQTSLFGYVLMTGALITLMT